VALSETVIAEHYQTPDTTRRARLLEWDAEMLAYCAGVGVPAVEETVTGALRTILYREQGRFEYLLHPGDRQLLCDALIQHADVFLTMDYRSVWVHRAAIWEEARIEVMTPTELVDTLQS
jgi:hypothetical protein